MTPRDPADCPLCAGSGEVNITPVGAPDSEQGTYGCPLCIAAERDEAEDQRVLDQIRWCEQEIKRLRSLLPAKYKSVGQFSQGIGARGPVLLEDGQPVDIDRAVSLLNTLTAPRRFRHRTTDQVYELLLEALRETDGVDLVVYRGVVSGQVWVRPAEQFFDGRFEELNDA